MKRRSELEPGKWIVNKHIKGPLFELIDVSDNNNTEIKSRYQISPL